MKRKSWCALARSTIVLAREFGSPPSTSARRRARITYDAPPPARSLTIPSPFQVDFEFQDPKESDFLGLKALLGNYLDGELFSSSELCDAIIKQSTVGTCLKTQGAGDESDPVAVMSVMNLQTRKDAAPIKEICAHLKNKCPKDLQDKLASALSENGVGLIINERVINVPQETVSPLVEGLFDEIEWAQEDEPTEELRASFKFKKYIVFSRVYMDDEAEDEGGKKRKRAGEVALVYPRPEDEFFHAESEWSFQWKSRTAEGKWRSISTSPFRRVFRVLSVRSLSLVSECRDPQCHFTL